MARAWMKSRPLLPAGTSKHRSMNAMPQIVPVEEGADVDDHLLAHVETAFERRRAR